MSDENVEFGNNGFNLERRTTEFGKSVVVLCKKVPRSCVTSRIISQLIGCGGSVGANYREANDALGPNDFLHKLKIVRRESKEVLHWLEMLLTACPDLEKDIRILQKEAAAIKNIFSSIINKTKH